MADKLKVSYKKLKNGTDDLPAYQTNGASGMDLHACGSYLLKPMERCLIDCGFSMELPLNYEAQIRPRSGLALKKGITVLNTPGTIDSDYRGEIKVLLINLGAEEFIVERGDRIAQMVIAPIQKIEWQETESMDNTDRSEGGFGHTGV
jgi:dUTP pyrophosphatase